MVPQDIVLFNETLGYNIGYGLKEEGPTSSTAAVTTSNSSHSVDKKKAKEMKDERIEEVVKRTKLDGLVRRLPQGYDTTVGERGTYQRLLLSYDYWSAVFRSRDRT